MKKLKNEITGLIFELISVFAFIFPFYLITLFL